MSIQAITTKLISTLGNKESLIPIMIKDGVDSASLTYKSFKEGGLVEGTDRFIDEFGTQAIWIGGIPFYKKLIDWSAYKLAKINPAIDPRIIADKEYATWASENAKGLMSNSKTQTVKSALTDSLKDGGKLAKNLYKGKIAVATALTLATFFALQKTKHKKTKDTVINEIKEKNSKQPQYTTFKSGDSKVFADMNNYTSNQPSFKGVAQKVIDGIMFNPVHNMKIIDAGITTERLACSRNATEFCEHAIKEGGFLFFIYGFGNLIEKGINNISAKVFKKPIELGIDVLMDEKFAKALSNGTILSDIAKMPAKDKSLTEKLNFIIQNPDNIVVQAAKKSKLVSTVKDATGKQFVDTSKYIDTKAIEALAENLKDIDSKFKGSGETIKKFLGKSKGLKVTSVVANIGISCLFLGYLIPKTIYAFREKKTGSTKFHVAEDIKKNNNKKDLA
ncbi:MAG: hypothetical protein E7Z90_05375 [Cyanobacteria bacterium SIG29]|nr:hypothetical protein [Cyanobacteria bacterium SIG29]